MKSFLPSNWEKKTLCTLQPFSNTIVIIAAPSQRQYFQSDSSLISSFQTIVVRHEVMRVIKYKADTNHLFCNC